MEGRSGQMCAGLCVWCALELEGNSSFVYSGNQSAICYLGTALQCQRIPYADNALLAIPAAVDNCDDRERGVDAKDLMKSAKMKSAEVQIEITLGMRDKANESMP
ncbi:hypothetical protein B0H16DRAFT_1449969 [Mycena metata]|uniref:Uncharacterized protein n=1 Tax=Mycena metata TaxID=1033252 RepID=A0AAD7JZS4_9AGAR|nr:hypothetical protein B0H16DRAFT_1449969 [Mycena metata]